MARKPRVCLKDETKTPEFLEKVEGEVVEPESSTEAVKGMKEKVKKRDELGQRRATYQKYKKNVDYGKLDTEEYKKAIGTVYYNRNARGQIAVQPKFASAAELAGAIDAYWDAVMKSADEDRPIIPDVEGLASYLGVSRNGLMNWLKGGTNKDFAPILEQTFNDIAAVKKQLGLSGKLPPIVMAMDFNNNHGYVNQTNQKVDIDVVTHRDPISSEQLIAMAKMLPGGDGNV